MNKFVVFLAIMMVMTVLFTMAAVPVFADGADTAEVVEHDHDGDGVADHDADAHTDGADTAEIVEHDHDGDGVADHDADAHADAAATTVDDGWATLSVSDYIALVVAAVILVAFVVAIVLFVPKKAKQR